MNVKEAYSSTNEVLVKLAGHSPIEMPDHGTDYEKVQYLLDEYARLLRIKYWRYRLFRDNRKIPEKICQYLGQMLTENESRRPNKAMHTDAASRGEKKDVYSSSGRAGDR